MNSSNGYDGSKINSCLSTVLQYELCEKKVIHKIKVEIDIDKLIMAGANVDSNLELLAKTWRLM
jgi:hypothetical protein